MEIMEKWNEASSKQIKNTGKSNHGRSRRGNLEISVNQLLARCSNGNQSMAP